MLNYFKFKFALEFLRLSVIVYSIAVKASLVASQNEKALCAPTRAGSPAAHGKHRQTARPHGVSPDRDTRGRPAYGPTQTRELA